MGTARFQMAPVVAMYQLYFKSTKQKIAAQRYLSSRLIKQPYTECPDMAKKSVRFYQIKIKIKSSLYSPYYAEACNELRGPSPRLSAWATQLRRNVATVASRWRHCVDLTGPGIEPQTSRTDSVRFATELTAGVRFYS